MANYEITDSEFIPVSGYVLSMLGASAISVELNANDILNAFNNSIEEYSNYITQWSIKTNIGNALGLSQATDFTARWVNQDFTFANSFSKSYSEQANIGGDIPFSRDFFIVSADTQDYYLPEDILVSELLWVDTPAIQKIMVDPYSIDSWVAQEFGWSYNQKPLSYVTPLYYSIQKAQHYEMRRRLYSSDYEYRIIPTTGSSNTVQLSPCPTESMDGRRVFYWYRNKSDYNKYSAQTEASYVNNPGTMRVDELEYSTFNSVGKHWVKQYTLATSKEILGRIRRKFSEVPIPDGVVTLDGEMLLSEAKEEKDKLILELKELLDSVNVTKLMDDMSSSAEKLNSVLSHTPMGIYVY